MKKVIVFIVLTAVVFSHLKANAMEDSLNKKQQSIATIAAFTAKGDLESLKTALNEGLDAGLTVNEIKEILVQMYAYCGFPRSLNAINTFMVALDERKNKGITDAIGETPIDYSDKTKYTRGKQTLETLMGQQETELKGANRFAPAIDEFLKEHLFADIFGRGVLTNEQRELATISALSSLQGVEPQLNGHKALGKNVGLSDRQINEIAEIVTGKRLSAMMETENGVKVQKVSFHNRIRINVVGNLFFPPNYDKNKRYEAIVVGHTFTGVKEQTSGLHARKLAELGYLALAFDASFWGESGGEPRNIEVPEIRVEDFSAAVDFLSNHPQVDKDRIGVLGICGGGCYSVSAAAIDHRIKAVATVSMYNLGRARRQALGDVITYEQRMKTLDEIGEQRTREFAGATRRDNLGVPDKLSPNDTENTREFYDYYRTPRGQHPNTATNYSFTSVAPMMNFFPFAQIETISPRPLLFIVGERAVSAYFSEDAYAKAAEPKELFVVKGASHVDLYDREEYMSVSLSKLDGFFKQYLK
jgi:fermentation-respiration switch protein FrsA (DUF1100 family)/alkylhydroperoxidase/carboxymuconolactone decarboxylase family protein YurZ